MRLRIGVILAYLLLGCILLQDALPFFVDSDATEIFEYKTEGEEKDTKKVIEDDWKVVKDKFSYSNLQLISFLTHPGSITTASEEIPDSAHLSIFSPPPNRV